MTVNYILSVLEAKVLCGNELLDTPIESACGSDLMSDVLAFVKEKVVLLTGLINQQVIRTAEMMDIHTIVFVRGKAPTEEMIELAKAKDIILLSTKYPMYVSCGKLYDFGLMRK